jgi:hypothetical protein
MSAFARVSPQSFAVAVSALDLSQRAAMAVPRQAMQGRREVHAAALHGPTEDAAARSVRGARQRGALARGEGAEGKVDNFTPVIANSCKAKRKRHGSHH